MSSSFCVIASLGHYIGASLHHWVIKFCVFASLVHYIAASLRHCVINVLHDCVIASVVHHIIASLHSCVIKFCVFASLAHYIAASLHHCVIATSSFAFLLPSLHHWVTTSVLYSVITQRRFQDKMSTFEGRVDDVVRQFDEKCRQMRNERKNSDWNIKVEVETRFQSYETFFLRR